MNIKKNQITKHKIYTLVSEVFDIQINEITDKLGYHGISRWDSLGHLKLILKLEEEFNISIDEDSIYHLNSVEAIHLFMTEGKTDVATEKLKEKKIHKGLRGIYVDNTTISEVDPIRSRLLEGIILRS